MMFEVPLSIVRGRCIALDPLGFAAASRGWLPCTGRLDVRSERAPGREDGDDPASRV